MTKNRLKMKYHVNYKYIEFQKCLVKIYLIKRK